MNTQRLQQLSVRDQAHSCAVDLIDKIVKLKLSKNWDYETLDLSHAELKSMFKSVEGWIEYSLIKDGGL